MLTPAICRAARGLLGISQAQLASSAKVGLSTVRNFEAGRSVPVTNNLAAIQDVLSAGGADLIAAGEMSRSGGGGVRLRIVSKDRT